MPFEHTICISKPWSWFQKSQPVPTRSLDELEELFYWCTANQNALVIDIPPGPSGLIYEHEANTAIALAQRINLKKGKSLPKNGRFISMGKPVTASSSDIQEEVLFDAKFAVDGGMQTRWAAKDTLAELVVELNPADKFNKISIFEYQDIRKGKNKDDYFSNYRANRIEAYDIDIWKDNGWLNIYHDESSMDDCKVIRFPVFYQASKIRMKILRATAPPSIYEFNVIDFSHR
jgi:alpha-L-fucosidase